MQDLLIPILIFLFFLFILFSALKKENFTENKFLIFSSLSSIFGTLFFTLLQISVSNNDITQQNELDLDKKILSFWIVIISYFIALVLSIIIPKKSIIVYITISFQILILIVFSALKFYALSFIL